MLSTAASAGDTYQWKLNGNNIAGANSSTFTAISSGDYSVEVTNSFGCTSASSVTNVTVLQQVTSTSIIGQNVSIDPLTQYTYVVSIDTALSFSWYAYNGAIISGQWTNSVEVIWSTASDGLLTVNRSNGYCSVTDSLNIQTTFDINEIIAGAKVYPNPTSGLISISGLENEEVRYQLFDSVGRKLIEGLIQKRLDISHLPSGSYKLILINEASTRIVIVNKI